MEKITFRLIRVSAVLKHKVLSGLSTQETECTSNSIVVQLYLKDAWSKGTCGCHPLHNNLSRCGRVIFLFSFSFSHLWRVQAGAAFIPKMRLVKACTFWDAQVGLSVAMMDLGGLMTAWFLPAVDRSCCDRTQVHTSRPDDLLWTLLPHSDSQQGFFYPLCLPTYRYCSDGCPVMLLCTHAGSQQETINFSQCHSTTSNTDKWRVTGRERAFSNPRPQSVVSLHRSSGSLGSRQALWQWNTPSSGLHDILDQACKLKTWARGLMSEVKALPMMHRSFSGVITADKIGIHDVLPYLENLTLRFGNLITSCSLQFTSQFLSLFLHASK